jgi:mono/diheme cytochrome c family protein
MIRRRTRAVSLLLLGVGLLAAAPPFLGFAQSSTPPAGTSVDADLVEQGQQIYDNVCVACHQPGGIGVAGIYPTLAGDPLVTLEDPTIVITTVLYGRGGMPRFNAIYSDEEIASVVSYIRSAWGNDATAVTAADVATLRAAFVATPTAPGQSAITGQDAAGDQPGQPESE